MADYDTTQIIVTTDVDAFCRQVRQLIRQREIAIEALSSLAADGAHHDDRIVAKRALRGMAEEMEADRG